MRNVPGQYEIQQLSAHDLREVAVIMRSHVESSKEINRRRNMARDFLGNDMGDSSYAFAY